MIDLQTNRLATLSIAGVEDPGSDELEISDLVKRSIQDSSGVTVDDLVKRNLDGNTGVKVLDLVNRNYDVILQPSSIYTNVLTINVRILTALPIVRFDPDEDVAINEDRCIKKLDCPLLTPKNTLFDPDMIDRFKLLATPVSIFTGRVTHIYWDKKYMDIFVTPDLDNICNKDTVNDLKGKEIGIEGHAIGTHVKDFVESEFVNEYHAPVSCKDEPKGGESVTYLRKMSLTHNTYPMTEHELNYEGLTLGTSSRVRPVQLVKLGKIEDIFGEENVPTYHLFNSSIVSEYFLYNGVYKVPEIVIPLSF